MIYPEVLDKINNSKSTQTHRNNNDNIPLYSVISVEANSSVFITI